MASLNGKPNRKSGCGLPVKEESGHQVIFEGKPPISGGSTSVVSAEPKSTFGSEPKHRIVASGDEDGVRWARCEPIQPVPFNNLGEAHKQYGDP